MLHATRMGRASPSADPIITAAFAARRILAAAVGRSGDRTLRRDRALTVYWKGQEEPGLLLYGLRRPDQVLRVAIREVFPEPAEVSEPWRLHGEGWAVDLWTVRSGRLRAGGEWRATLETVLERLLRSGLTRPISSTRARWETASTRQLLVRPGFSAEATATGS